MTGKYYKQYLKSYGPHFTKKLCEYAVSMMETDKGEFVPFTKTEVDQKMAVAGIKL